MKKQIRLLPLLAILWAASTAHAQVVIQYAAGDGARSSKLDPFNHGVNPPTLTNYQNEAASTSLTLPESLTSIGSYAFRKCSGLGKVCWLGPRPTTYGTTPFLGTSATHYVPGTYLDEYQALAGLSGAQIKPDTQKTRLVISPDGSQYRVTYLAHSGYNHQPQVSTDLESWGSYYSLVIGNDQTNNFSINPALRIYATFV